MTRNKGFTLVEMLVAIAVLAIVTTLGIPSFQSSISDRRLSASANDFVSALQLAKTNAASTNSTVTICTKKASDEKCDAEGTWSNGWLVFIDNNNNGQLDDSETLIYTHNALHESLSLSVSNNLNHTISFRANGLPDISSAQTIILCDSRGFGPHSKAILVSIGGRGSVMNASDLNKSSCNVS